MSRPRCDGDCIPCTYDKDSGGCGTYPTTAPSGHSVVMDLSKCGGTCRGDCIHYQIGIACESGQTYEPASSVWAKGCECSSWCRANPQPITDKHHMGCTHYNDTIKVVKISLEGHGSYCDADIAGALQALADGGDYCYQVEIMDMLKRDYDVLPEFEGF